MRKFLIIRFSSIGDIVLTTPVIRCLKQQIEDSEIHYLTKKQFVSIVENNPYVDKVHSFSGNLKETMAELKKEDFECVFDLHNNLRTLRVKRGLKSMKSSFNKLNFQKWLLTNLKINRMPHVHIVDRYLATTHMYNIVNDQKGLDYFIPQKDEVTPNMLPENYRNGYTVIVIGAKHATKQLPVEKLQALCRRLIVPIVLVGGPEDAANAEKIIGNEFHHVYNACGKYNLNQSASIIKHANLVISHDTGMMHIAAAFHKDIISIWGNTVPEFGMYPYMPGKPHVQFEVRGLKCRPCSKIGYNACPKGHFDCMNKQNIDEIANVAMTYLNIDL